MVNSAIISQGVATVLLADFVTGVVHWAEDAYARPDTPLIGRLLAAPNLEHYRRPRAFLARSWLASSWDLLLLSSLLVGVAWYFDRLGWQVVLFAILAANANQIHKWTHQTAQENGAFISWLQKVKLLQTRRHHARHHCGAKNSHYCVITNLLNPLLEEFELWTGIETLLAKWPGLIRRPDPTVSADQIARADRK